MVYWLRGYVLEWCYQCVIHVSLLTSCAILGKWTLNLISSVKWYKEWKITYLSVSVEGPAIAKDRLARDKHTKVFKI